MRVIFLGRYFVSQGIEFSSLCNQFQTSMTTDRGKSEEHNKYTVKKDLTNIFVLRTVLSLKFLHIPVVQVEIGWRIKDSRQVDLRRGHQGEVTPY